MNIIYGLEEESSATLRRTFRRLLELDADVLNAVYITPHFWTWAGRQVRAEQVIQLDQALWTYRNQIIDTPRLSPERMFLAVKMTEVLYHLRPCAWCAWCLEAIGATGRCWPRTWESARGVLLAEIGEFLFHTRFERPGHLQHIPGFPPQHQDAEDGDPRGDARQSGLRQSSSSSLSQTAR